jgi:SurA-like N-terminal domain
MVFRARHLFFYAAAAFMFFTAGWACNKYANPSGISDGTVVAVVDGHKITFGDWMRQTDLLRTFGTPIDPDDKDQVKAVLDSLIDQQLVLQAAQKAHYSDASFDETLKTKLQAADLKIKDLKDKLTKDMQTLERVENNYQEPYKKMLLARQFASSQVGEVAVTDKDLKDWYDDYAKQAKASGRSLPPFAKVKDQIKPNVQAEKFLKDLQDKTTVDRKTDVIDKYLAGLSASADNLDSTDPLPAKGQDKDGKDDGKE